MMDYLRRRFDRLNPRTQRLLRTAVVNYFARFASALTVLITIPMARQTMSGERFGIWMMLGALLTFFSFADFGVGNGALNRVTAALRKGDKLELGRAMSAAYCCTAVSGALLIALWFVWAFAAKDPLAFAGKVPEVLRRETLVAFSAFVVLVAVNIPLQLVQKFQLAYQEGYRIGFAQLAYSLCTVISLPLALYFKTSLVVLLLCTLGMQVFVQLVNMATWFSARGLFDILRHAGLHAPTVLHLLRTGSAFFMLQLCAVLAYNSDAFFITQQLGQAVYGDFAAVQRIFLFVSGTLGAALLGLWPAFGEAIGRGEIAWVRRTYTRAMLMAIAVMGSICLFITFAMPLIARYWLHMDVPPATVLPLVLGTWAVIDMLEKITTSLLNGAGLLRPQLLAAMAMAAAALAGKWLLVSLVGPWGSVLATILAYTLIVVPVQIILLRRLLV
ncbi:lipopolysaccharide biosynthesis protein [Roseateles violae]|uniref:O-antigen/teichoic acid export membrane protein n=1 Tax=Roseateles violae TaxID=3058042 RepID=A0ABT8DWY7_9BURK|nr:hypothetical protein [Pelomonas sp. PFR6]MDN3920851.1 hypothetical protein [Pelomonas sp. PFR6]